uniref:E-beta-farnesene synthase n=1 Tax=Tanacetum cinerariifolium TaxID=118510 RepID=A0A6L2JU13_TANCI|nr:hypothetical protein [Tanacetum cinerariifolium]
MADVNLNVNAPAEQAPVMAPPTRTNDQILPRSRWVPVGKSNCYLDVEKSQSNPIYKITVDILKDTARYNCQVDKQWFDLTYNTLRDALQITRVNNNNPFSSPPTPDALINFVNKLGKTSASKRPRASMLQILWGIVNRAHIDYAEKMWEEFTQSIHSFVKDKKNLAVHTQGKKKASPIVIPSIRFTKLIIHHLQSKHKFHPRPNSPFHLPYEEYILGYLKSSAKGTKREVFGMPIPNELITANIQGEQYYKEYLEKVAKHQRYLAGKERSDPDSPAPKPTKATKKSKPSAPKAAPVTKPAVAKASKSTSSQQPKPKPAPAKTQEKKHTKEGLTDSDTESDEEVPHVVKIRAQDEGQARPNPSVQFEGQARLNPGDDAEPQPQSSPIVHAGPNLEHIDLEATDVSIQQNPNQMDEGFTVTAYLNVQENLKLTVEEQTTAETEAGSIVSVTIHQDMSAIPPMISPVIDLISRPDSPNDHQPLPATATATATTTTTITTLPLPPLPQQGTTNSILIKRISKLEQIMANLIQDNKHLEERLDSHGSRLYKLENLNINQQVSKAIDEIVTDSVDWAIQAPLRNRFRDLPEADMKEILHQRMWETNSYKAHEDHMMLYEALEKSMNRDHTNDLKTINCFLDDHDMRHKPGKIAEPETDLLVMGHAAQLLLQYAVRHRLFAFGKCNPCPRQSLMYIRTLYRASMKALLTSSCSINQFLVTETANRALTETIFATGANLVSLVDGCLILVDVLCGGMSGGGGGSSGLVLLCVDVGVVLVELP